MKHDDVSEKSNRSRINHILKLADDIYRVIKFSVPPEWLASNMTVAQLRVLLLIHSEGHIRMSAIAAALGVKEATATGIVNNLVKKEFVTRQEDPEDRRLVICSLSSLGEATMISMWALGQSKMQQMLQGLTTEQLKKAEEVAVFLLANVISKSKHS